MKAVVGDQRKTRPALGTLRMTRRESEVFTQKVGVAAWGAKKNKYNKKRIASQVFERGYKQYLKSISKSN